MEVFSADNYVDYLRNQIELNAGTRGYQSRMAAEAKCQNSYFSRILRGNAHLTPEQAMRLTQFWGLNEDETEYFLEIVNLGRTNFPPLQRRTKRKLSALRDRNRNLARRLSEPDLAQPEASSFYYSSWHYMAVHMLVGIEAFQTSDSIAQRLSLPVNLVRTALSQLRSLGLVMAEENRWVIKPGHLHLPASSPLTSVNHSNWRHRAVMDSQQTTSESLHYTVVQSHSERDFQRLRELWLQAIETGRGIMKRSADEEVTCLCLDYFRVN